MPESVEIKQYEYYNFSSRDSSIAQSVVLLYGDEGYLGAAYFSTEDEPLRPAQKLDTGHYALFYDYQELQIIIDMLRNESPVYVVYNGELNTRLSTTREPVGEGEE